MRGTNAVRATVAASSLCLALALGGCWGTPAEDAAGTDAAAEAAGGAADNTEGAAAGAAGTADGAAAEAADGDVTGDGDVSGAASSSGSASGAVAGENTADAAQTQVDVVIKNETGYDVGSIALRAAGSDEYDPRHTFEGIVVPNGTSTTITFAPIVENGEPVTSYDVLATTVDDAIIEVRNVDLLHAADLTLRFEESIGYVSYTDEETNQTVDNRAESEQAMREDADSVETYDMATQMDVPMD